MAFQDMAALKFKVLSECIHNLYKQKSAYDCRICAGQGFAIGSIPVSVCRPNSVDQSRLTFGCKQVKSKREGTHWPKSNL